MTEEHPGNPDSEAAVPTEPTAKPEGMRSGQGMVTLGCWIIVGIYLITGLLMNEYWIAWLAMIPAIAVLLLGFFDSKAAGSIAPVPTLIKVLGYVIAIVAGLDLIEDVRFASSAFDEAIDVVGSLAFWGAGALCFFGARSIQE